MMNYNVPMHIVRLDDTGYHVVVAGTAGDCETGYWIIDTGASKTVFDKNIESCYQNIKNGNDFPKIQSAGIGEFVDTTLGEVNRLQFGKLVITGFQVALISLDHVNALYEKYTDKRIIGLLGSDFLIQYHAVIDYRSKKLRLRT